MRRVPPLPSIFLSLLLLSGMSLLIAFYGWVALPAILVLALLPVLLLLYSTRGIQLCLRTGRIPSRPKGWESVLAALSRSSSNECCIPIGSAWSFWLSYRRAPPHPVDLRSLRSIEMVSTEAARRAGLAAAQRHKRPGRHLRRGDGSATQPRPEDVVRVQSGATMGEVTLFLAKRGLALSDRSQFDDLCFGSGIRTAGHGFHSEAWMRDSLLSLDGWRRGPDTLPVRAVKGKDGSLFQTIMDDSEWVIVSADVVVVKDETVSVSQVVLPASSSLPLSPSWGEWVEATYRYAFVDAKYFTLKFARTDQGCNPSVSKAQGEWERRWNHARRLVGFPASYTSCCRISDIHTVIGSLWPVETIFMRLMRYVNLELFVHLPVDSLPPLMVSLSLFHARRGGRTEVRALSSGLVALDLAVRAPLCSSLSSSSSSPLPSVDKVREWCSLLHSEAGVREVCLHTGKFQADVSPLSPVPYSVFWNRT